MNLRLQAHILILLFSVSALQAQFPVIHSTSKKIDINDNGDWSRGQWTLNPDLKPDIYKSKVDGESKTITFHTDIDSIQFEVKPKRLYDFVIVYKQQDSCWHQINTFPDFDFTPDYIKQYKGTYSFEVPEVQELVHIIFALTPAGKSNKNLIQQRSPYYKSVLDHFSQFERDPVIQKMDSLLQLGWYTVLKMDACSFQFQGDKIVNHPNYQKMSWDDPNYIARYVYELQAFAKKTSFRQFYKTHTPYFHELKLLMEKQSPIDKQWRWLEKQFDVSYDHYRITFSPLVGGRHSTNHFQQEDFKQTIMFICGPIEDERIIETLKEGLLTRVVFTEINHNYVNPISDRYSNQIEENLLNLQEFVSPSAMQSYNTSYSVFNEYVTWSVYSAYAWDTFSEEDFDLINQRVENQMVRNRGFIQFKAFNQYFLKLYQNRPSGHRIQELYPEMLAWFGSN